MSVVRLKYIFIKLLLWFRSQYIKLIYTTTRPLSNLRQHTESITRTNRMILFDQMAKEQLDIHIDRETLLTQGIKVDYQ